MALGTWRVFDNVVFVTKWFEVHFQGNLHRWVPRNQKEASGEAKSSWSVSCGAE